jgi:hypothetical protein
MGRVIFLRQERWTFSLLEVPFSITLHRRRGLGCLPCLKGWLIGSLVEGLRRAGGTRGVKVRGRRSACD